MKLCGCKKNIVKDIIDEIACLTHSLLISVWFHGVQTLECFGALLEFVTIAIAVRYLCRGVPYYNWICQFFSIFAGNQGYGYFGKVGLCGIIFRQKSMTKIFPRSEVPQKVVYSIHNIIISGKMITTEVLFHLWEEVVVRRRPIRRFFDKVESTFLDSSRGHCGRICRSIVLVEEHGPCQFSTPNLLDFLP